MHKRTVWHVVGARPNFMKVAPVRAAVAARTDLAQVLVHTGQHADPQMSDVFFRDLDLPPPDLFLGVTGGTHASLTGRIMEALEPLLARHRPDLVLVAGDVNSTLAAALVAAKNDPPIPVAHLEAGLRSFDRAMPEEVNRVLVDRLSDLCLTPSPDGDANLRAEGVPAERIVRVGNVMIDSLERALPVSRRLAPELLGRLGLEPGGYALATLHRPANVDDPVVLAPLLSLLADLSGRLPVVFPVHPRTRRRIEESPVIGRLRSSPRLLLCDPQGYFEFQALMADARLVLTDSGGVQEETTALGVPCLTLRDNTERPVTVTEGTNTLVGRDPVRIAAEVDRVLSGHTKAGRRPALWDGRAAERVADALQAFLGA
ncbi:MAG: hypothetical protein RL199_913 [Pseudomonadota bacterium]|jgi:UDP-N-acetylglucosamine 2-epimerase (non-hydrolysing)